jgi:low temperature requirement protein LtrA
VPSSILLLPAFLRRGPSTDLRRGRDEPGQGRVTNTELFFDLVFVFAVTQLSHSLLPEPGLWSALHAVLLFGAVWWTWIDTSWVTNWLDPDRPAVRLMLLVLMAGGLIIAACIPRAFADRGLAFALCYAGMQIGRSLFTLWALAGRSRANVRNFQRITIWMTGSAVLWVVGGLAQGEARFALWVVALALDLGSAWVGFWVPRLGRSTTADWDVDGGHIAERCAAFVLIALGESITVTGASFYEAAWTAPLLASFLAAFLGTAAMWWLYFDTGAEHGSRRIAEAADPGRLARFVYTYLHAALIAAIILGAVADEMTLHEPAAAAYGASLAITLAAPVLYLLANLVFKGVIMSRPPLSHLVGLGLMIPLGYVGVGQSLLLVNFATSLVLVIVAIWEYRSFARGSRRAI